MNILGNEITIHAAGESYSVLEYLAPADFAGPPLHVHDFDELFYTLEGRPHFTLGDEAVVAAPGDVVNVRGGTPHTFANRTPSPARFLVVIRPGGFERFFIDAADLAARDALDPGRLAELNARYGVRPC